MIHFIRASNRFLRRASVVFAYLSLMMMFSIAVKAQPPKAWSRIGVDLNATRATPDPRPAIYMAVPPTPGSAAITNNPDVAVTTATNTTQSENSVFVSPTNPQIVLNSNNSSNWPVTTIYGASYWVSTNGGAAWTGSTAGAGGTNKGDPTTAIDLNGRMYIGYISSTGGMGVSYSTNNGATWTARTVSATGSLDKNHLWVDNSATSPLSGRLYNVWTNFLTGHVNVNDIEFSRSTDAGVNWSAAVNLSNAVAAGSHNQGVNVQTGPNGEVYVTWAIYDCWPCNEVALGFTKSTDGGTTWSTATRIRTINGTRNTVLGGSKTMRHASFPSMTVNQQSGKIYIVWTNIGVPGTGTGDFEIYMISSTDGGSNWNAPLRVNQDAQGNGKDQWMPWLACDPVTGDLSCIFYDSRNFTSNNAAETYVAVSQDHGVTWTDSKVSDFSWSGDGIVGFAGNYAGDYLGISARNGNVVPCWSDDHSGNMLAYVSPFTLTTGTPDITPPVITNVQATSITSNSAVITWTTDEASNSVVDYGLTTSYGNTQTNSAMVTSHSVTLTGLAANSVHHYRVSSTDAANNTATDVDHSFQTGGSFSYAPTSTTILEGSLNSGSFGNLATNDASYYVVNSTTGRNPRTTNWYGSVTVSQAPASITSLMVTYDGKYSRTNRTQTLYLYNWVSSSWTQIDSRSVGTSDVTITNTQTSPANFISGSGEIRLRVNGTGNQNITCSGDYMQFTVGTTGGSLSKQIPIVATENAVPTEYALMQNYPNPFNPTTNFTFRIAEVGHVKLVVYDVLGRDVATIVNDVFNPGEYNRTWDASSNPSGVYYFRLTAGSFSDMKRMILLK